MLYFRRVKQGLVRVLDAANRYPRFSLCRPNFSIAVSLLGARLIVAAAAFHPQQPLSSLPADSRRPRPDGVRPRCCGWDLGAANGIEQM